MLVSPTFLAVASDFVMHPPPGIPLRATAKSCQIDSAEKHLHEQTMGATETMSLIPIRADRRPAQHPISYQLSDYWGWRE